MTALVAASEPLLFCEKGSVSGNIGIEFDLRLTPLVGTLSMVGTGKEGVGDLYA
jgi:hypothetical protein